MVRESLAEKFSGLPVDDTDLARRIIDHIENQPEISEDDEGLYDACCRYVGASTDFDYALQSVGIVKG